jgi:hypothetical protein
MASQREEAEYWETQASALRRTALDRIRTSAEKMQASLATMLGVAGAVTFLAGPSKLNELDLSSQERLFLAAIAVISAALALLSIGACVLVSQGEPRTLAAANGEAVQRWHREAARRASALFGAARVTAIVAAALLIVGTSSFVRSPPSQRPR